jgi:hypothetical protein
LRICLLGQHDIAVKEFTVIQCQDGLLDEQADDQPKLCPPVLLVKALQTVRPFGSFQFDGVRFFFLLLHAGIAH